MYSLTFYVGSAQSNNGYSGYQTPATIDVSINGGISTPFTTSLPPTSGFVTWQQFSMSFTATTSNTTITFLNGTPLGTNEAGLDNVSLTDLSPTAAPEPSTLALLGIGAVSLAGYGWRRRRQRA